jgi:hypothetical protein
MGFVLSILYLVVFYLTPEALFGFLGQFHIQLIIAILALLSSVPRLIKTPILKASQSLALLGLACAGFVSTLIAKHWLGGSVSVFIEFISSIMGFFFIFLNFNSKKRLRALVLVLFAVCLIVVALGTAELISVSGISGPPINPQTGGIDFDQWNTAHPYLFPMKNEAGEWFYRIRGLGIINDPNDFAQLLVCVIPLIFIFWRPKKRLSNMLLVIPPAALLLFGVFLTHSRGALLALIVVMALGSRRRIGTVPAAMLAGCIFLGAMALQFSGGRDVSASAGEDRTALWGEGLAAFRTHPLIGVGYRNLPEYTDAHLTAHNSIIVCAAELGMVGFYFWSVFLFATFKDGIATISPTRIKDEEIIETSEVLYPNAAVSLESVSKEEIHRMGRCVLLSLVGYLVAGWFLSRAIVVTLFVLGGMAEAVFQMAQDRGMISSRPSFGKLLPQSAGLAVGLLATMYVLIRTLNFIR